VRDLRREAKRRFGAGEEQRGLRQAYIESFIGDEDEYTDGPCDAVWATNEAFAQTVPTTLAGLFAMLAYAGEIEDCEPDILQPSRPRPIRCQAAASVSDNS